MDIAMENESNGVVQEEGKCGITAKTEETEEKVEAEEEKEEVDDDDDEEEKEKHTRDVLDICNNADADHVCMVTFKLGKNFLKSLKVHSCVLAAESPVFEKMFFGSLKDNDVKIKDAKPKLFKTFVRYLYTHSSKLIHRGNAHELLYLASKYCTQDLKNVCENVLANDIRLINLASTIRACALFDCQHLSYKVFQFIVKNQEQVFSMDRLHVFDEQSFKFLLKSSFLAVKEDTIFNALETWVELKLINEELQNNNLNRKQIIQPFLKYIRLISLSKKQCQDMIRDEICCDDAKKEIQNFVERPDYPFIPKYFSSFPRLHPLEVLRCKAELFNNPVFKFNIKTKGMVFLNMYAFGLHMNKTSTYIQVQIDNFDPPGMPVKKQYKIKTSQTGFHLCFLPNDGIKIQVPQKCYVEIKDESQRISSCPCNESFECDPKAKNNFCLKMEKGYDIEVIDNNFPLYQSYIWSFCYTLK